MLRCADGTLYTGWTFSPEERLAVHNRGRGARYTASRLPVEMVYLEEVPSKSEALRREMAIKKMPRRKKVALFSPSAPQPVSSGEGNLSNRKRRCVP
ncbi:MAG: GIY-YIG nuclease family protein [Synergistaceae bacterium]|nr:GIY-YIG nuclease family protein [Synergistaceae bacterium]